MILFLSNLAIFTGIVASVGALVLATPQIIRDAFGPQAGVTPGYRPQPLPTTMSQRFQDRLQARLEERGLVLGIAGWRPTG